MPRLYPYLLMACAALPALAQVRVTVHAPATVLFPGSTLACTAVVEGTPDARVTWSAWEGAVQLGQAFTGPGLFLAPGAAQSKQYLLRATSVADGKACGELIVGVVAGEPSALAPVHHALTVAGWAGILKAPSFGGLPFLDLEPETPQRYDAKAQVAFGPALPAPPEQVLGYGLEVPVRLPGPVGPGGGSLLSFREGGAWVRCEGSKPLKLTGRVSKASVEVLDRTGDAWLSSMAEVDLQVRGLVPFAGRSLYGPAWDAGEDDGQGESARFRQPAGMTLLADDRTALVADRGNHVLRTVAPDGTVKTPWGKAGTPGFVDGAGQAARFREPAYVAAPPHALRSSHPAPAFVVADSGNHAIRQVDRDGNVTTLAGSGTPGLRNGWGKEAQFNNPQGVAIHRDGTIFVADAGNRVIRRIQGGHVSTFAGTGALGALDGKAKEASFTELRGVAFPDSHAGLYVLDGHALRWVSPEGDVLTVMGQVDQPGFLVIDRASPQAGGIPRDPEAEPAIGSACFRNPCDIKACGESIYIADTGNHAVREVAVYREITAPGAFYSYALGTLAGDPQWPGTRFGLLRDSLPWAFDGTYGTYAGVETPRGLLVTEAGLLVGTGDALGLAPILDQTPCQMSHLLSAPKRWKVGGTLHLTVELSPVGASDEAKAFISAVGYGWRLDFLDAGTLAPVAPRKEGRGGCDGKVIEIPMIFSKPGQVLVRLTLLTDGGATYCRVQNIVVDPA